MTETQTGSETGQSANGSAPAPGLARADDATGERWLGVLVITAGLFLLFVGIDRVTGGALTRPFYGEPDASG